MYGVHIVNIEIYLCIKFKAHRRNDVAAINISNKSKA